jgi:hypothetical protein
MQSRMNCHLPGCAGHLSGPVTLGNRLLPLLISKQARGGACVITSISNPNSLMMLKANSCWYCLREPLMRNSLWVGINGTNNSPNGTSTSLVIPCPVVEVFFFLDGFAPLSNAPTRQPNRRVFSEFLTLGCVPFLFPCG